MVENVIYFNVSWRPSVSNADETFFISDGTSFKQPRPPKIQSAAGLLHFGGGGVLVCSHRSHCHSTRMGSLDSCGQ